MERHLEPVPDPTPEELAAFEDQPTMRRPPWWRLTALIVVAALVVATPFAYVLSRVFD
ncbi:MAG TPA: hypothetical protein VFM40_00295 [Actinomycetota bacterium]|nr:hypothetical protein [Actinomycetota bacterium]